VTKIGGIIMRIGRTVGALALLLAMWSCAQYEEPAPIVGWTCLPSYGGCDEYGGNYTTANATVGLPFEWRLTARCNTGTWNVAAAEVGTGRLPPGLEIEPQYFRIVGVPTRAGSFSFQMLFRGISCPGSNYLPYGDWNTNYTIVVTGS
jgi:hypothetical protein